VWLLKLGIKDDIYTGSGYVAPPRHSGPENVL
jgi:hypothetical protein